MSTKKSMKQIRLFLLSTLFIFHLGCKKNDQPSAPSPSSINLTNISNITANSAVVNFEINDQNNPGNISEAIIIVNSDTVDFWNKPAKNRINKSECQNTNNKYACSSNLTNLSPGQKYFIGICQILNGDPQNRGAIRSGITTFETLSKIPVLSDVSLSNSDIGSISAALTYTITDFGGPSIIETGLCYSTKTNPTVNDIKFKSDSIENYFCTNPFPKGIINGIMHPLIPNTTYYVRAYAINGAGVGYGKESSFTTKENLSCLPKSIDLKGGVNSMALKLINEPSVGLKLYMLTSAYRINGYGNRSYVYKLNADGSLLDDIIFRSLICGAGYAQYPTSSSFEVLSDGKLLLCLSTNNIPNLCRLNKDGSKDNSFNITTDNSNGINYFKSQADGKIIVSGNFGLIQGVPFYDIARLNPNGSLDQSFQYRGSRILQIIEPEITKDGKILTGGLINGKRSIIKLNANGEIDTAFKPNFATIQKIGKIFVLPDNKILVAAQVGDISPSWRLYRLNNNGTIDNTFSAGLFTSISGVININVIFMTSDNKLMIGGNFNSYNSTNAFGMVKVNMDGTRDNSFNATRQFNIFSIVEYSDGKWLLGVQESPNLILMNKDGSLCR